uniref:Uncharacterized protein n=1 Tax=Eptatretus burgeri TaxID=7764 RepID=A0A8C4WWE0_EPTBU
MRLPAMGCASSKKQQSISPSDDDEKNQQNGNAYGDTKKADGVGSHGADAAAGSAPNRLFGFEGPEKMVLRSADGNMIFGAIKSINRESPNAIHGARANLHLSESQIEFFRMLDEKIERVRMGFHSTFLNTDSKVASCACTYSHHCCYYSCQTLDFP